jgi:hypothetical protein
MLLRVLSLPKPLMKIANRSRQTVRPDLGASDESHSVAPLDPPLTFERSASQLLSLGQNVIPISKHRLCQNQNKGDSDLARDREGGVSVGCAGAVATETPPSACGAFPPLIGGIFREVAHAAWGGATGHENAIRSRDREGAVEVISRAHPSLTVGAQICGIFIVLFSWTAFPGAFASAQAESLRAPGKVFPLGETLVYEVRWDPPAWVFFMPAISAGEMTFRFQEKLDYEGVPAYRITAQAISSGFLPRVTGISVQDSFESIVDAQDFCSFKMIKKTREGKRQRDIFLTFDRKNGKGHFTAYDVSKQPPVELKNEEVKNIPACVQDLLSAIYHTRLRDLKIGEKYPLTISDNGVVKEVELRVKKRETVESAAGSFPALKVETVSVFGGLFRSGGSLLVWLSDDEYKIPVKFEAKVKIGKLFGTIKKMQGANTLAMR